MSPHFVPQGTAVVKMVFGSGKTKVAGCAVTSGKMSKAGYVAIKRGKASSSMDHTPESPLKPSVAHTWMCRCALN